MGCPKNKMRYELLNLVIHRMEPIFFTLSNSFLVMTWKDSCKSFCAGTSRNRFHTSNVTAFFLAASLIVCGAALQSNFHINSGSQASAQNMAPQARAPWWTVYKVVRKIDENVM